MWNFRRKFLVKDPLPVKDPKDYTLTESSTEWSSGKYCPRCKDWIGHLEFMASICNSCGGTFNILQVKHKSVRKIWNGSKWVRQYRYPNDSIEIVE